MKTFNESNRDPGAFDSIYDDWAESYTANFYYSAESAVSEARDGFGRYLGYFLPGGSVLELGCGVGIYLAGLAECGFDVTGLDISPKSLDLARRFLKERELEANFIEGDLLKLEPEQSYDAIVAVGSFLAHFLTEEDQFAALEKMLGFLKPGGLLMLSLHDFERLMREEPDNHHYGLSHYGNQMENEGNGDSRICFSWRQWSRNEKGEKERVHRWLHHTITANDELKTIELVNRALTHKELEAMLARLGLEDYEWLSKEQSRYFQPICMIRKPLAEQRPALAPSTDKEAKPPVRQGRAQLRFTYGEDNQPMLQSRRRKSLILWDGTEESTGYLRRLLQETDEEVFAHHLECKGPDEEGNKIRSARTERVMALLPELMQGCRPFGFSRARVDLHQLPWIASDNMINMYFMTQAGMSCGLTRMDRILMPLSGDRGEPLQTGSAKTAFLRKETLAVRKYITRSEEQPSVMFWLQDQKG
ncbi:class I SAM-dependent methyltransferase [Kiloniella sp. b19]|uniref:class I SAM-dependent methyltransferase n=1 Tax=Kiloniella sp. GXU_MW_B19 TaxID=3141326 RepID=UPI0031D38A66